MTLPSRIRWKPNSTNPKVASVRIRCLNIIEQLTRQGIDIAFYDEKEPSCDVVIFSKAYSNNDIELAQSLKEQGTKVIFDLCDNHFLSDQEVVERLTKMMKLADLWVSSTNEMARIIVENLGNDTPMVVIGDAVEKSYDAPNNGFLDSLKTQWQLKKLQSFLVSNHKNSTNHGRLLWFGNHSGGQADSGMSHLSKVQDIITDLAKTTPSTLTVISNSKKKYSKVVQPWSIPTFYCEWHPLTFFDMLRAHDTVIIPIKVNDFTRVKSNNRIALPLSQGINVVADSIDSYLEFKECTYLDNWHDGILNYATNDNLRQQHISDAKKIINNNYSIDAISQQWINLFKQLN